MTISILPSGCGLPSLWAASPGLLLRLEPGGLACGPFEPAKVIGPVDPRTVQRER